MFDANGPAPQRRSRAKTSANFMPRICARTTPWFDMQIGAPARSGGCLGIAARSVREPNEQFLGKIGAAPGCSDDCCRLFSQSPEMRPPYAASRCCPPFAEARHELNTRQSPSAGRVPGQASRQPRVPLIDRLRSLGTQRPAEQRRRHRLRTTIFCGQQPMAGRWPDVVQILLPRPTDPDPINPRSAREPPTA